MEFGVTGVASITVLAYGVGLLVKASGIDNKWIPVICGLVGMFLGVAGMLLMTNLPADDYISAAAVGMASGLAATGAHQAIRQLTGSSGDGGRGTAAAAAGEVRYA